MSAARCHKNSGMTALAAAIALSSASLAFAGVYDDLMGVFTNCENRLPGSAAYERSFQALEKTLRDAGLEPHVQTFDTLVPRTEVCRLTVAGAAVEPVFAFNEGLAALVTDAPIEGPLLWLGNGSLEAMEGQAVSGCVAVINIDLPASRIHNAFMKGAKAVLLAGSGRAGRWTTFTLAIDGPAPIPCVFVPADAARLRALREAAGAAVSLEVKSGLRDAQARNLWVEIPGRTGVVFNLGMEEAALVSAPLDTYGAIPEFCPDTRGAANAALLAEALTRLAGSPPPNRSLFAVFWGARNWNQEGARHFYYALGAGSGLLTGESIPERLAFSKAELEQVEDLLRASELADLLESDDAGAKAFTLRLREKLVGLVNNANATLRLARLERAALKSGADARRAELDAEIDSLTIRKGLWNGLREQISDRKRADAGAPGTAAFTETVASVRRDLLARQAELKRALVHLETSRLIGERFANKAIVAHFDFDFANARDPWLLSVLEDPKPYTTQAPTVGGLLLHLSQFGAVYRAIRDPAWPAPLLESALAPFYMPFNLCVPAERSVPTAPGALLGVPGYQLMTAGEQLADDGMPFRADCDLRGLIAPMAALVKALGEREEFSLRRPFPAERGQEALTYRFDGGQAYRGLRVVNYARGSADMEGSAKNAVLRLEISGRPQTPEFNRNAVVRVNTEGYVFMPMMSRKVTRSAYSAKITAFGFDGTGKLDRVSMDQTADLGVESPRIPLFYQYGGGAFSYGFAPDPLGSELYKARTIDARTEAPPRTAGAVNSAPLSAFYTDRPGRIKRIGGQGELLLGITDAAPEGEGVALDPVSLLNLDGTIISARDSWRLNERRLMALRQRGSINDDLESLHADAAEHLELADEAARSKSYRLQQAHAIFASCLENRVYGPLRGIADDLVRAVVLLLLLNIPFALAMERLVFGFTSIYKQVMGVAGFFLATFALLFVTHPAFSLASAPIIVFLAFVIIMLSAITTKLVLNKINKEIRAVQGLASKLHGRDDESGTMMAAILIGISGMRNRPLKTILTAATVVLLTFTILAFASLTARLGVVSIDLGKGQDEDRIELHRLSYQSIAPDLADAVDAISGGRFRVFERGWLSHERVIYNPANGKTAAAGAMLGLEPEELTAGAKLAALLPGFKESGAGALPPLYLPASIAEKLEAAPGAELRVNGFPFVNAGLFDASVLPTIETIDGMKILPPDFDSTLRNMGIDMDPRVLEEMDRGNFAWFSPDRTVITDWNALRTRFGATLGYLVMYPKTGEADIEKTAAGLASVFQGAVHTKSAVGARKVFFTTEVKGSGFAEVIVPLLLGGLIIFSSLMGSIVDREREIFTYSAMGLSPPSVGALFFAESAIYSVVGGMGGYLLGQVTAKLAAIMGARGWITPPPMNFASLNSVLTIFVVMGVVLLSTVYPALKAGRSANPGVARKWKMPSPKGNRLDFIFPFTVSKIDFVGILSFIREHFGNHADATLGGFAARNVRIFRNGDAPGGDMRLGIEADISLAPFDLGIFQHFRMFSKEFEIKGIEEIVVELERVAGTPAAWRRANRGFADELREQFLLWRSLPIDTVEHYRRETEKELGLSAGSYGESTK